jgi:plasmid maintenance system antidote protein VapI
MRTRSRLSTTTDLLPNPHAGEILMEEFLKPMAKRAVTADTDLRLARYFGMSEGFFLGLQSDYELMQRRREIGDKLKAIRPRAA